MTKIFPCLTALLFITSSILTLANNPEELGKITWLRDLEAAQKEAAASQKPILVLFQEIPGCSTCKKYGNQVLSHPLIVETIETYFVPLAIYNNTPGKDATVLKFFKEPSWNNPVVRVIDAQKKDLLPRLNDNYTASGLVSFMLKAFYISGMDIPPYLLPLREELTASEGSLEKTTLAMYCFWTGEKEIGSLDGVVQTEAGFMDRREVVNVYYNPDKIDLKDILTEGAKAQCADYLYAKDEAEANTGNENLGSSKVKKASSFRLDSEPKYYLSKTVYRYLPMSPMQAMKANALVGKGKDPAIIFSPRQKELLLFIQNNPQLPWENLIHTANWQANWFTAFAKMDKGI